MAKKSKLLNEIRSLGKGKAFERNMLKKLENKIQKSPVGHQFSKMVANPEGEVKMSEVLEAFIAPYTEFVHNQSQQEKLVGLATTAWNLAIMPEEQQQTMMESLMTESLKDMDHLAQQDFRELLTELIERKQTYFADNKRMIIEWQVQDLGNQWHLSVASTLVKPKAD